MQELRLVLIIFGALIIAALLLHGLWTSKKEKPAKFGEKPQSKLNESVVEPKVETPKVVQESVDTPVVKESKTKKAERKEPELHFGAKPEADPLLGDIAPISADDDLPKMSAVDEPKAKAAVQPQAIVEPVAQTVVSEPAQAQAQAQAVEPTIEAPVSVPEPTITAEPVVHTPVAEPIAAEMITPVVETAVTPVIETPVTATEPQVEPRQEELVEEVVAQAEISQPVPEVKQSEVKVEPEFVEPEPYEIIEPVIAEPEPEPAPLEPSYISLCVHARNGGVLMGRQLFTALENHGLIFGENSVYHRHLDRAGTQPVIFSVTNLVAPGNFPDINDAHFETPGIGFFLMLPCPGRADDNFNMMLQTAQRIADDLNADVLDHERNMITPYRITAYRDKAKLYANAK
ncbi:cell division protein ZipA [Photobacterium damselae subsp. damselae]|uniref:cell division protein ZipA n=1 Tax=Photobacterium damselae TaxID=38293 RepID=UPI001EED296B|nr:cell division protein ZipA [Photobacterium damselae]UJZ93241.1 cell division protein ZipA [Photobacterium damselae subsp. damselae]UJZ97224.1 cell division protein ZipA [Photobacterium damselae subsp. damselae]